LAESLLGQFSDLDPELGQGLGSSYSKIKAAAEGMWGGDFSVRLTLCALFTGSGNFHMVSSFPHTMIYYLDEKPVGSRVRIKRSSLNGREFTTFLSVVTVFRVSL
jgi:hypothetical protein